MKKATRGTTGDSEDSDASDGRGGVTRANSSKRRHRRKAAAAANSSNSTSTTPSSSPTPAPVLTYAAVASASVSSSTYSNALPPAPTLASPSTTTSAPYANSTTTNGHTQPAEERSETTKERRRRRGGPKGGGKRRDASEGDGEDEGGRELASNGRASSVAAATPKKEKGKDKAQRRRKSVGEDGAYDDLRQAAGFNGYDNKTNENEKEEEEEQEDEQEQEQELVEQDDEKVALILSRAREDQFSPYAYYMASIPSGAFKQQDAGNGYGGPQPPAVAQSEEENSPYLEIDGVLPNLRNTTITAPHVSASASASVRSGFIGSYYADQQDAYFACDSALNLVPTNRDGQAGGDDGDRGYGRDATPGGGRPVPARRPVYSDVDLREQETGNTIYSSNTEPLSARPPRKKKRNRKPRKQDDDSYLDRANEDEHSSSSTQPSHSQDEREDDPNYDNARDKKTRREQQPPERRRRAPSSGSSSSSSARARGVSLDSRRQTGGATAAAAAASVVGGSVGASTESGRCGYPMAWNAEFQKILELPQDDEQQQLEKFERLSALAADFQHTAKTCGKIIISEKNLPNEFKTIRAVEVGGHAGGQKYIYHGILFKFATDWLRLYGSDEYAMKAAGLELKGAMRYYLCEGLSVPLMALIDYRGYRLVCVSILPINTTTLCYGSCDGGKNVFASDERMNARMRQAAARLNLKGHMAGVNRAKSRQFLYGPADIEGHRSWQDSRYYVLDFARVFPPTAEADVLKTFLYRLFRPEFIKTYSTPLSSDAFSPFGGPENEKEGHNAEVREATRYLLETTIPAFARWLDEQHVLNESSPDVLLGSHAGKIDIEAQLTELLHMEGINCRYLGRVCNVVKCKKVKKIIIHEMLGRVVKNKLRARLRDVNSTSELTQNVYRKCVLEFLNLLLGQDQLMAVVCFWQKEMKEGLRTQFDFVLENDTLRQLREDTDSSSKGKGRGNTHADPYDDDDDEDSNKGSSSDELEEEEKDELYLLRTVDMYKLFKRIEQLTGVTFSKQSKRELKINSRGFKLVVPDIVKMSAKAKHMNIVSLAEGNSLWIQAKKSDTRETEDRLFRLVMSKFEASIRSTPDNRDTLNNYADVLCQKANNSIGHDTYAYLAKAFEKYKMARSYEAIFKLGNNVQNLTPEVWQNNDQLLRLSSLCYQALLSSSPSFSSSSSSSSSSTSSADGLSSNFASSGSSSLEYLGLYNWGRVLIKQARKTGDDRIYAEAGDKFRRALAHSRSSYHAIASWAMQLSDIELAVIFEIAQNSPDLAHINGEWCYKRELVGKEEFLCKVVPHIPRLEVLRLSECQVSARTLERVAQMAGTSLLRLQLGKCPQIDDRAIRHLAKHCTNLVTLDLSACVNITDAAMRFVSEDCHALEELDISYCERLTASSLEYLAAGCPELSSFAAAGCTRLTKEALIAFIPTYAETLESLDISHIPYINDDVVTMLANCFNLRHLRLCYGRFKPWKHTQAVGRDQHHRSLHNSRNADKLIVGDAGDQTEQFHQSTISDESLRQLGHRVRRTKSDSLSPRKNEDDEKEKTAAAAGHKSDGFRPVANTEESEDEEGKVEYIEFEENVFSYDLSPQSSGRYDHHIRNSALRSSASVPTALHHSLGGSGGSQLRSSISSPSLSSTVFGLSTSTGSSASSPPFIQLESLGLAGNMYVTDAGLESLLRNAGARLRYLDISRCKRVTAVGLGHVLTYCQHLEVLDVRGCSALTDSVVRRLLPSLPGLRSLYLDQCSRITDAAIRAWFIPSTSTLTTSSTAGAPTYSPSSSTAAQHLLFHHQHQHNPSSSLSASPYSSPSHSISSSPMTSRPSSPPLPLPFSLLTATTTPTPTSSSSTSTFALLSPSTSAYGQLSGSAAGRATLQYPNLTSLSLGHLSLITDGVVKLISEGCPNLEYLNLAHNTQIMDLSFRHLARNCTNLKGLKAKGCSGLTDGGVDHLADGCHFLTSLDLSHCLCIHKIVRLADGCPFLTDLDLFNCHNIDNASLLRILRKLPLQRLNMFGCRFVKNEALDAIAQSTSVRALTMGCNKTTDAAVAQLRQARPDIDLTVQMLSSLHKKRNQKELRSSSSSSSSSGRK